MKNIATKSAQEITEEVNALPLDEVVKAHTAFNTFADLVNDGYCPTLITKTKGRFKFQIVRAAMAKRIADAFDTEMEKRGSRNRAFRG